MRLDSPYAAELTSISPKMSPPASVRTTFGYYGDSSTIAEASLPSNARVQRQVPAVGTKNPTAEVQVYAYSMGS